MANPKRILLVDDEEDILSVYSKRLKYLGYEVETANDGLSAIRRAIDWHPDCILLDIMMPEPNGWDTCRILQMLPSTQNIPVLMCSTKNEREDVVKSLAAGAKDYMIKPFDMKVVTPKLTRILGEPPAATAKTVQEQVVAEEVEELIENYENAKPIQPPPTVANPAALTSPQPSPRQTGKFQMETQLQGDVFIFEIYGHLGSDEGARIQDGIQEAMALSMKKFVLDLTGVTTAVWEFNDVLDRVYKNTVRDGARVRLVAKNAYVRQVLTQRQFRGKAFADIAEAIRDLR